jgi:hypothetical protein
MGKIPFHLFYEHFSLGKIIHLQIHRNVSNRDNLPADRAKLPLSIVVSVGKLMTARTADHPIGTHRYQMMIGAGSEKDSPASKPVLLLAER